MPEHQYEKSDNGGGYETGDSDSWAATDHIIFDVMLINFTLKLIKVL